MTTTSGWRIAVLGAVVIAAVAAGERKSVEAAPVAPRAAKAVTIEMSNDGGANHFAPNAVTVAAGDTVKFVAASGSHQVTFWADSIPTGSSATLMKAMPDPTRLSTARFPNPGEGFSVVFAADFPKGVYKFFCQPHLMRGMVGAITLQ